MNGRVQGKRPVGRTRKRWIDNLLENGETVGITLEEADHLARDRELRSRTVYRLLERVDLSAARTH